MNVYLFLETTSVKLHVTMTGANANRYPPHTPHGHQSHARTHAHTSHTAVVYVGEGWLIWTSGLIGPLP